MINEQWISDLALRIARKIGSSVSVIEAEIGVYVKEQLPEQGPCSACGDGDMDMHYHVHGEPSAKPSAVPMENSDGCGHLRQRVVDLQRKLDEASSASEALANNLRDIGRRCLNALDSNNCSGALIDEIEAAMYNLNIEVQALDPPDSKDPDEFLGTVAAPSTREAPVVSVQLKPRKPGEAGQHLKSIATEVPWPEEDSATREAQAAARELVEHMVPTHTPRGVPYDTQSRRGMVERYCAEVLPILTRHFPEAAPTDLIVRCSVCKGTEIYKRNGNEIEVIHECAAEGSAEPIRAALQKIADNYSQCGCDHSDENCCEKVGEFCPHCIAEIALKVAPAEPTPSKKLGLLDRFLHAAADMPTEPQPSATRGHDTAGFPQHIDLADELRMKREATREAQAAAWNILDMIVMPHFKVLSRKDQAKALSQFFPGAPAEPAKEGQ